MNIIITGASSGIGYESALLLSDNPANTVIAISRNLEKLENLKFASRKRHANSNLHSIMGDVANEQSVIKIAEEIKSKFQEVSVLINNAGQLINKTFGELSSEDWMNVYGTNVFGAVNMIRHVLPMMKSGSHIVNISSMGGFQGSAKFKGLSAYSSSKAALVGITECLAEELKDKQIAVNCLCLGSVQTEMFAAAFPSFKAATTTDEISAFISQFALEGQKLFNGKIIPVSNSTP